MLFRDPGVWLPRAEDPRGSSGATHPRRAAEPARLLMSMWPACAGKARTRIPQPELILTVARHRLFLSGRVNGGTATT